MNKKLRKVFLSKNNSAVRAARRHSSLRVVEQSIWSPVWEPIHVFVYRPVFVKTIRIAQEKGK